jgi:lipoprotein-anchoring transpeptidase ErfK/SrfK
MKPEPAPENPFEIHVSIADQTLHLLSNGKPVKSWPVSTSKFGTGSEPGSFRTPTGSFRIAEKFGHDAPLWSVFKSRLPTGEIARPGGDEDGVLSRILWLEGTEDHNANTHDRYIYIHGTNQEHLIGTPASHGCVRLRNPDVAELFELVPPGTPVRIA